MSDCSQPGMKVVGSVSKTGLKVGLELVPSSLSKRLTACPLTAQPIVQPTLKRAARKAGAINKESGRTSQIQVGRLNAMQVTHTNCAGVDVHKKTVVVCCLSENSNGQSRRETRTYGTTTAELLRLSNWFATESITHIAMESTGEYWKPVYNMLESSYEVMVVNSHHFKQVPGRKTDVKDAEWLAELD